MTGFLVRAVANLEEKSRYQLLYLTICTSTAFRENLQLIPMLLLLRSPFLADPYSGGEILDQCRYNIPKA